MIRSFGPPIDWETQYEYTQLNNLWANGMPCKRCHRPVVTTLGEEAESCDYGMLAVGGPVHHGCALILGREAVDIFPPHVIAWVQSIDR